jgi:hypothetical protein
MQRAFAPYESAATYENSGQLLKKAEIVGFLERVCQELELTDTQHQLAKSRYEAVGTWLAHADNPLLRHLMIYPQGSVPLGTTVKAMNADREYLLSFWTEGLPSGTGTVTVDLGQLGQAKDVPVTG